MTQFKDRHHSELEYKDLLLEFQAVQQKLSCKIEALLAVSEDLGLCQHARDRYKASSDTYERNLTRIETNFKAMKLEQKQKEVQINKDKSTLMATLHSLTNENRKLLDENVSLKTSLVESRGDSVVLRQQIARQQLRDYYEAVDEHRVETSKIDIHSPTDLTFSSRHCSQGTDCSEKATFLETSFNCHEQILPDLVDFEKLKEQYTQLERDLRSVLCEKEELVCERETYKCKMNSLSQELSYILNGDDRRIVSDLDGILTENRYLKARLVNVQEETGLVKMAFRKYRKGAKKGTDRTTAAVVTPKQVGDLLGIPHSSANSNTDYRSLSTALFDAVNEKQLVLAHQRKANKILGSRVVELETKILMFNEARSQKMNTKVLHAHTQTECEKP